MLANVEMIKHDHYQYGEAWKLEIGDLENPDKPKISATISEYQAENFKKSFTKCEKFGKFQENEKWT